MTARHLTTQFALVIGTLSATSVACDLSEGSGARSELTQPEQARGLAGKADAIGACETADGDACGGQSADGCWCDAACEQWGDCCGDKRLVCEGDSEPNKPPAGPQDYVVAGVTIVDQKAISGDPVFTISYAFASEGLSGIEISCNDDTAITTLIGADVAGGQPLRLSGGDFYCFRMAALVSDLADVTGGHELPSFQGEGAPDIQFDLGGQSVTLTLDLSQANTVIVHHRLSETTLQFVAP